MTLSTEFKNRSIPDNLYVMPDYAPWQNQISPDPDLYKARLLSLTSTVGPAIGEAELELCGKRFGDFVSFYHPIRVVRVKSNGDKVNIWKGFVVRPTSSISDTQDGVRVLAKGYRWYLNKITKIRGRWYTNNGDLPNSLGSPFTVGDGRFTYEKFRGDISDNAGYLQNDECIFNRGGYPDCFAGNSNVPLNCIFYNAKVTSDTEGLNSGSWEGVKYDGKFWTFASILKHVERYWIQPYFGSFVTFKISDRTYNEIESLGDNNITPMNFTVENLTPLQAIDKIVKSIPGRWIWYIDYSKNTCEIIVKNIKANITFPKSLILGDNSKIATSDVLPNIADGQFSRDATDAVRYSIARGGKLKVITTLKLVPLWPRYQVLDPDTNVLKWANFEDKEDFDKWKEYDNIVNGGVEGSGSLEERFTNSQLERYPLILRKYGLAKEGNAIKNSTAFEESEETINSSAREVLLDSFVGIEYAAFERNILNMFFKNTKILRRMEPPQFDRFSDKIVVFMKDPKRERSTREEPETVNRTPTEVGTDPDNETATTNEKRYKWIDPDFEGIGYRVDEAMCTVTFDKPQYQRKASGGKEMQEQTTFLDSGENFTDVATRKIYVTATLTTDVAAILGRKRNKSFINRHYGSDFSDYVEVGGADIIVHENAWYPINFNTKTQEVETNATSSGTGNEMDGDEIATILRKCTNFPHYKKYVGNGAQELLRALINYLSTYSSYVESGEFNLGYLSTFFRPGDKIKEIKNSDNDGNGGFYNLSCYVTTVTHEASGDGNIYTTSISVTNKVEKETFEVGVNMSPDMYRWPYWQVGLQLDTSELEEATVPNFAEIEALL